MDCDGWWDCHVAVPWQSQVWPWLTDFLQSAGFGALAAVLAAVIAFIGVRRQTRLDAWWQRAQWALELLTRVGGERTDDVVALAALRALRTTRLAKREEQRFLRAVVDEYVFSSRWDDEARADTQGVAGSSITATQHPRESIPRSDPADLLEEVDATAEAASQQRRRPSERARVIAAEIRVATDEKLGEPTPQWIQDLAEKGRRNLS